MGRNFSRSPRKVYFVHYVYSNSFQMAEIFFFFPLYPQILRKKRSLNKGCFLPVSSLDHSRLLTALFCSGRIMHLNSKEISVESAMNPTPFSPFSWGGFCRPRTPRALALPQRQPGGLPGGGGTHRNP